MLPNLANKATKITVLSRLRLENCITVFMDRVVICTTADKQHQMEKEGEKILPQIMPSFSNWDPCALNASLIGEIEKRGIS